MVEAGEAFFGEAGAAGVAVVNEDGGQHCVGVKCGGDTADVPPVASGEEGEQTDGSVLGSVQGAGDITGSDPDLCLLYTSPSPRDRG